VTDPTLIQRIRNLPTFSPVMQRINAVMANRSSSALDIVNAIKLDPAVSGKVLRLANSAYVGIPRTVSSLHNAVVLLGNKRVHSLVMASTLLSSFGVKYSPSALDLKRYWMHSFAVALAAEALAKHLTRYDPVDSDEMFTAGIIHDIGKLALGGYDPDRLQHAVTQSREESRPFFTCEEPDATHSSIGEELARHWNFPKDLCITIAFHHAPTQTPEHGKQVTIVHLADIMTHIVGFRTFDGEVIPEIDEQALASINLPAERLKVIGEQMVQNVERIQSLIEFVS